ncbi:MAG: hypothetical protein H6767_03950 [Candidatus Peribacteria bacterium]|nr:MAG: hypothetical protein H6767_03950 [Candidatus Peribacteria bacterium]
MPKEHFYPAPKVESIVLHFITHDNYRDIDDGVFLEIIKQGFREPRKKLLKNLLNSGYDKGKILVIFEKLSISDTVRGEELGIEEWIEVVKELEIDER